MCVYAYVRACASVWRREEGWQGGGVGGGGGLVCGEVKLSVFRNSQTYTVSYQSDSLCICKKTDQRTTPHKRNAKAHDQKAKYMV